jgi:hypothetical protein
MQDALAAYPSVQVAFPLVHMHLAVGDHVSASEALANLTCSGPPHSTDVLKLQFLLRAITQGHGAGFGNRDRVALRKRRAKSTGSSRKRSRLSLGASVLESPHQTSWDAISERPALGTNVVESTDDASRKSTSGIDGLKTASVLQYESICTTRREAREPVPKRIVAVQPMGLLAESVQMNAHELTELLEVCDRHTSGT